MRKSPRRSRSWATSILLVLLLIPARASAQETTPLEHNGKPGIWFPSEKAKKLLEDVAQLPGIRLQLELLGKRLELEKSRSDLLEANVKTSSQIAEAWKSTATEQAKVLANKDPWWKSPYLWLTVGVVAGSAATVGIAYAVKHGVN